VCDQVTHVTPVGSLRRFDATVGDISLLAVTSSATTLFDALEAISGLKILRRDPTARVVEFERDRVTFHTTLPDAAGAALLYHTGARGHVVELVRRAKTRRLQIGPDGVQALHTHEFVQAQSEEQVYGLLGLPFIAPELREGQGEIEAAEAGALPTLLERGDIRGDLHMHSTWSDGRDDIEAMVKQSLALGYEYVAITDHSQSSGGAGGLAAARLERQRHEIDEVRRRVPGIEILHGAEVDILPDGSLDYPDAVLAELDIVLASLHDQAGQGGSRLTDRYLGAIQHPLVNVITHPTNRLVGYRPGYNLDFPRLFEAAAETGTVLEIDGAPAHLDMDGALARRAIEAGVIVAVDSDCHRAEWLERQMTFGVATARRGWAEARHVLNTRALSEVRAIFERKKKWRD
jgi:DNA polymerase (family 10)